MHVKQAPSSRLDGEELKSLKGRLSVVSPNTRPPNGLLAYQFSDRVRAIL